LVIAFWKLVCNTSKTLPVVKVLLLKIKVLAIVEVLQKFSHNHDVLSGILGKLLDLNPDPPSMLPHHQLVL